MRLPYFLWVPSILAILGFRACAEDLTTLDGRIFSNISDISKYPKQVFFDCNGVRTNVVITNLPESFRALHGIAIKTNVPVIAAATTQPQLNPIDLFLWQNRESALEQRESASIMTNGDYEPHGVHDWDVFKLWSITLKSAEVDLEAYRDISLNNKDDEHLKSTEEMRFDIGNEAFITNLFSKFIEWSDIATSHNAVDFEKELDRHAPGKAWSITESSILGDSYLKGMVNTYTFEWKDRQATLNVQQPDPCAGRFDINDIMQFESLLKRLPKMKEKLSSDIRNQAAQTELFK